MQQSLDWPGLQVRHMSFAYHVPLLSRSSRACSSAFWYAEDSKTVSTP